MAANWRQDCPGVPVWSGRQGVEARRQALRESQARVLVDATHPFAVQMSQQLMMLAQELGIPYLRYERPSDLAADDPHACADMEEAATRAIAMGRRIFLATGSKDLAASCRPAAQGANGSPASRPIPTSCARPGTGLAARAPVRHAGAVLAGLQRSAVARLGHRLRGHQGFGRGRWLSGQGRGGARPGHPAVDGAPSSLDYPQVAHDLPPCRRNWRHWPGTEHGRVAPSLPPPCRRYRSPWSPVSSVPARPLLRGLVQRRQSRRLALLINEFGEVAIDGDLLRAEGDARARCRSRISPMA
jgi:hypothetical protein